MIKVKTKTFGILELEEKQRIIFNQGILGFEENKEYACVDLLLKISVELPKSLKK